MDYKVWEGFYNQILSDFNFSKKEDERSAAILLELLAGNNLASQDEISAIIQGKEVCVVGGGRNLQDELNQDIVQNVIIAADGTTSDLLRRGFLPDIIVTDLDGNIKDQLKANEKGAIVAIHAHGDNIEAVRKWTPRFHGKVAGTVQCRPFGALYNFGGFTDGDRCVFLAHHFGAKRIQLIGFDFENVTDKMNCDTKTKARKLQWAKKLISHLGIPLKSETQK